MAEPVLTDNYMSKDSGDTRKQGNADSNNSNSNGMPNAPAAPSPSAIWDLGCDTLKFLWQLSVRDFDIAHPGFVGIGARITSFVELQRVPVFMQMAALKCWEERTRLHFEDESAAAVAAEYAEGSGRSSSTAGSSFSSSGKSKESLFSGFTEKLGSLFARRGGIGGNQHPLDREYDYSKDDKDQQDEYSAASPGGSAPNDWIDTVNPSSEHAYYINPFKDTPSSQLPIGPISQLNAAQNSTLRRYWGDIPGPLQGTGVNLDTGGIRNTRVDSWWGPKPTQLQSQVGRATPETNPDSNPLIEGNTNKWGPGPAWVRPVSDARAAKYEKKADHRYADAAANSHHYR